MSLPPELWAIIAANLSNDLASLRHLCSVNTSAYNGLLPTLYHTVRLSKPRTVVAFCDAIISNPDKLGVLVGSLNVPDRLIDHRSAFSRHHQFMDPPLRDFNATRFRDVLRLTPNLQELTIIASTSILNTCLDASDGLLSFKLDKLVISNISTEPVYQFLLAQPTIESLLLLSINGDAFMDDDESRAEKCSSHQLLPNLKSLVAPVEYLKALTSNNSHRPNLSQIIISSATYSFNPEYFSGDFPFFFNQVAQPIRSIGWVQSNQTSSSAWHAWGNFIGIITSQNMHHNIEEIKVVTEREAQDPEFGWILEKKGKLRLMSRKKGFEKLERIEIFGGQDMSNRRAEVLKSLAEMKSLGSWVRYIPTLKRVCVYGVDLV